MKPEFSRPVRLDAIGDSPRTIEIEADERERAALAARFDLEAIETLASVAAVRKQAGGVLAEGRVRAAVVQRCVATGAPLPEEVDAPFRLLFTEEAETGDADVELDEDALDTVPFDGGTIDLGEAAAETLSLALDPYPRAPDADEALRAAGVRSEEEAVAADGPFAGLREKLAGKSS